MTVSRQRGHTLIEVLIAVLVFGLLAASAYTALDGLTRGAMLQREHNAELAALQMTVARLDADLRQLATRAVRASDGQHEPALVGQRGRLIGTRSGWANPAGLQRSQLQRFSWQLDDDRLVRLHWPVTDTVPASTPVVDPTLEGLELLELRYRDPTGVWHEQWPVAAGQSDALPSAIEVRLTGPAIGTIRRVLVLAP